MIAHVLRTAEPDEEGGPVLALTRGLQRARILEETQRYPHLRVWATPLPDRLPITTEPEFAALAHNVRDICAQVIPMSPVLPNDLVPVLQRLEAGPLSDVVASILPAVPRSARSCSRPSRCAPASSA